MTHQTQYRPVPPETQIQALREELDAAKKKVDRYVNLVATLSEELDNLRRGICHNCQKKFVPSCSPISSSSDDPRPSLWRRLISGRPTNPPSSGIARVFPPDSVEVLTNTVPRIAALQDQITTKTSTPSLASSSTPTPSSAPRVVEIQPKPPHWSISHNAEIKPALHVDLVKAFDLNAKVHCVKFSPDGKYLAAGVGSGKTNIYDVEKGLSICRLADYSRKKQSITWNVEFTPDNQYIATAGADYRIMIWEIARKRTISILSGRGSTIYSTTFSPNGRFLVSGDASGSVRKWRVRDSRLEIVMPREYIRCVSVNFSPSGRYIASVHMNGFLRIWDARTNQLLYKWRGHTKPAYCLAFTQDGKGLVSGGADNTLKYWDISLLVLPRTPSRQTPVVDGGPGGKFEKIRHFEGHTKLIRSVAASPDNRWVVTSSQDQSIRIWDPRTATWQCTLSGHTNHVWAVDFSPAGQYLASGSEDGQVVLWRYRTV